MYSMNFDFEKSGNLTEEAMSYATQSFIEEARAAGMQCTRVDSDIVNIAHEDVTKLKNFMESLNLKDD